MWRGERGACGCGGRERVHAGTEGKERGHEGRGWQGDICKLRERGDIKDTKERARGDADMEVEERVRDMQVCVGREGKETCREGGEREGTCGYRGKGEGTCIQCRYTCTCSTTH